MKETRVACVVREAAIGDRTRREEANAARKRAQQAIAAAKIALVRPLQRQMDHIRHTAELANIQERQLQADLKSIRRDRQQLLKSITPKEVVVNMREQAEQLDRAIRVLETTERLKYTKKDIIFK